MKHIMRLSVVVFSKLRHALVESCGDCGAVTQFVSVGVRTIPSNLAAMSMQTCVGVFITLLHQGNIGVSGFSTVLEIGRTIRHFASCRTLRQLLLSQAI